jgi:hypothetical protein
VEVAVAQHAAAAALEHQISVVDYLDVSAYLAVPVRTLYQWSHRGEGPPAIRSGRHLRYDPDSRSRLGAEPGELKWLR